MARQKDVARPYRRHPSRILAVCGTGPDVGHPLERQMNGAEVRVRRLRIAAAEIGTDEATRRRNVPIPVRANVRQR